MAPTQTAGVSRPTVTAAPKRRSRMAIPWLLATPAIALFVLVIAFPLVQSLAFGFFDKSLLSDSQEFVGLEQVTSLLNSDRFWRVAWNTAVFVVGSSVGAFVVAVALALALNTRMRGKAWLRTVFLMPWILPGVVVSFLWAWIFDSNYGLANGLLYRIGGETALLQWLDEPGLAMFAVIVAKIWHSFPWMMIMILAALQSIPQETDDAAAVDGAFGWRKQAFVVLPQIKSTLALVLLLETIWGLQHFEIPFVMTDGGPVGSTTTLSVELYKTAFQKFDIGTAGGLGIIWMLMMGALVAVYITYLRRQEGS